MFTDVFLLIFFFVASGIRNCNSENPVSLFIADKRKMIPDIFFRRVSFSSYQIFLLLEDNLFRGSSLNTCPWISMDI